MSSASKVVCHALVAAAVSPRPCELFKSRRYLKRHVSVETHFCVCKTDELDIPIRCTHMRGVTHSSSTRAQTPKCSTSEALYVSDSDREARRQGGQNRFVDGPDRRGARCCVTRCRSLAAIRSIRTSATRDHKSHGSLTEMRATGNKIRVRQTQAHAHA